MIVKVAEILDSEAKWCQLIEMDSSGRLCIIGAMRRAGLYDAPAAYHLFREAAREATGVEWNNICSWNDAPERTFAEVHAVACEIDRLRMLRGLA
jgi:hypothetical protein